VSRIAAFFGRIDRPDPAVVHAELLRVADQRQYVASAEVEQVRRELLALEKIRLALRDIDREDGTP